MNDEQFDKHLREEHQRRQEYMRKLTKHLKTDTQNDRLLSLVVTLGMWVDRRSVVSDYLIEVLEQEILKLHDRIDELERKLNSSTSLRSSKDSLYWKETERDLYDNFPSSKLGTSDSEQSL